MGWAIGFDSMWQRDIGYDAPAFCDHPDCDETIDRGLAYVCGNEPYGGGQGCGLYFCGRHQYGADQLCERCQEARPPFRAKSDHPDWIQHKATHSSWAAWREEQRQAAEQAEP